MDLTNKEMAQIIKLYYQNGESPVTTLRKWQTLKKLHKAPFSKQFVSNLVQRFEETGNVAGRTSTGRPSMQNERLPVVEETLAEISSSNVYGCSSTREISKATGISQKSVHRILTKKLSMHPYHISVHQALTNEDMAHRVEFANWMLNHWNDVHRILWSDESTFSLDGRINRHNCVIWSVDNPHVNISKSLHSPWVMVWLGFSTSVITPPFFFEETVTADSYSSLITTHLLPFLKSKRKFSSTIYQQDGAPAHYSLQARGILIKNFGDRLIGRGLEVKWPPRSPDLSPLDYWLWPFLKDRIYHQGQPRDIIEMKTRISEEVGKITRGEMTAAINNLYRRCQLVLDVNGEHFEHLL